MGRKVWLCSIFVAVVLNKCQSLTMQVNNVTAVSGGNYTFKCPVSTATNITVWTYLQGPTGYVTLTYHNGLCTASPSGTFVSETYSYACHSTEYQVTLHDIGGRHKGILNCRDGHQLLELGTTWFISKIVDISRADELCNCEPPIESTVVDTNEGDNITLACTVQSGIPYVNWNKNIRLNTAAMGIQYGQCITQGETYLDNASKYIYTCNNTVYQVTKLNVTISEHNDMYMCTPSGQTEGTGSNWIIKVKAPVTSVTLTPSNYLVNVKEHTVVEFTCTTSTARPAASVYWYRHENVNSQKVTQITDNITTTTDYNDFSITTSSLRFVPTRQDNDTKIYCKANNSINTMLVSIEIILLNVMYKADDPHILQGSEYRVIENTPGTLSCSVKGGNPTPTLSWSCYTFPSTNQTTINHNGNVTTTFTWDVSRTHGGTCTCKSHQTEFPNKSIDVSLVVLFHATITSCEFYYKSGTTNVIYLNINKTVTLSIIENESFTLNCSTDGNPTPTVHWKIPEMPLVFSSSVTVNNLTRRMKGDYVFTANNLLQPSFTDIQNVTVNNIVSVHVLYPPVIQPMNNISKLKDEQLYLICNYTSGMPDTTSIKWTRDIDNRQWSSVVLNITYLKKNDTGIYTCTASNIMKQSGDDKSYIGQHNQSLHLDVQYETVITDFTIDGFTSQVVTINESDPIRLICNANSNPTAVMTLRHESDILVTATSNSVVYDIAKASCLDAGTFYCSARNDHNELHHILELFVNCVPDTPTELKQIQSQTTTSSIQIEWTPGFNGGSPQIFYIKFKKSTNSTWTSFTVIDNGEETMDISLTGLAEDTQYDIVIFASNIIGNSSESPVLIALTKGISNIHTNLGPLVGSIVGGVIGCVILVVIIIVIIRRCTFCKVCGKTVSNKKSDKTKSSPEEQAYYNTGRLEDTTHENNDATAYDEIGSVTYTDKSVEDSITNNVASVNNYEMVNLNTVESTPYSIIDQTEERITSDTANEDNQAVYEEMKIQVF